MGYLKRVGPELWVYEATFGFLWLKGSTRMTVVRLESGDLWVHSPLRITDGVRKR